ncbi:MAG: site-2 protease family protein [Treponema sp.]|jgi:regulator of sigma E protease|nr:site-2 protease family protein [Treponema sp.]
MIVFKVLLGLIGLGVVVFVHELGHFLAARLVGIGVEAFSIGWGKPFLKKKIGQVEYRLGMFPLGGYCKMRGENEFREAWENSRNQIAPVKGTFFGVSPWRRIVVSLAGPLFNLIFAVLVLSVIWGLGFEVSTLGNRIVLASEINHSGSYPADEGGLKTGDRILEIDGKATSYYHEIQEIIAVNPEKNMAFTVDRDGKILRLAIRPNLDKGTGAGKIGVYFWNDPVIEELVPGSPADAAGLRKGDRILRVNGKETPHNAALMGILGEKPESLAVDYERNGEERHTVLVPVYGENGNAELGIGYGYIRYRSPALPPPAALARGTAETWKTLAVSLRSLGLLFRGIDLTRAVSGPVRITYMVGDIAAEGFGESFARGIQSMANFLALISIALCIMNLLPLPVLDGGMTLLFIVEWVKRKPLHPKAISAFQTVGVVLIFGLMIFAVFGDILYLVGH